MSLAAQLGFLGGCKYVIRDYAISRGFGLHVVVFTFALIALIGPALGGSIAMSGSVVQPDKWSQHRRTLIFLACVSSTAAMLASILPYVSSTFFWPALFLGRPSGHFIFSLVGLKWMIFTNSFQKLQRDNLGS